MAQEFSPAIGCTTIKVEKGSPVAQDFSPAIGRPATLQPPMPSPSITVVVAAHGLDDAVERCVAAHVREFEPGDELFVIATPGGSGRADVSAQGRPVRLIHAPAGTLTPVLWSMGIREARGELVRVTIAPFVPASGWRAAVTAAHDTGADAVGGPIEPAPTLRLRDSAMLFQRYRAYLAPLVRETVHDLPADHASYRKAAIDALGELWADGFWEPPIHAALVRQGRTLLIHPAFVAEYVGGESAVRFVVQRFLHGMHFGRTRLSGAGVMMRLLRIALFILPGGIFLLKIVRDVLNRPGHGARLVLATPWLLLFLLSWSLGEWVGAVLGPLDPSGRR